MSGQGADRCVVAVSGVEARLLAGPSPVEATNAEAIDRAWREALARKPRMFDGRILLAETVEVRDSVLHVGFREARFASLVWLRAEGGRAGLRNVFGAAVVVSRDGAALLGRMAPHTANAGQVYFPCGTPDLEDVAAGAVDLEGSIVRELAEETGLAPPLVRPSPRAVVVFDGELVGLMRRFDSELDAAELSARAERHLAAEATPELDRIVMARAAGDLGPTAPRHARLALGALLES